ncbi:arylsulfatase-like [Glandiceps talaboti]
MQYMYLLWILSVVTLSGVSTRQPLDKPNIIVLFADDMGYGDLSSYGHPSQEFGAIDEMAVEGIRFTHWYSASSLCTPSRAALLTGRLPYRSGVLGTDRWRVYVTYGNGGLPREEITVAEALKDLGYTTGMVGKWHLGTNGYHFQDGYHLPTHHGFDYVATILPYTNVWECDAQRHQTSAVRKKCFLYYNTTIIQQPTKLDNLTETFVQDSKAFIYNNKEKPFFLYLAFSLLHVNLVTAASRRGSSRRGLYGDSVNELAWAVDEILQTVKSEGISRNTLVFFISDNGPHVELCEEGGSPGMLKGMKASTWEGGIRVPAIAWWPDMIAPGQVNHEILSTMDVFPTAIDLAGGIPPKDRILDGKNIKSVLLNNGPSPHEILFFYCDDRLSAVRFGPYKVHFLTHAIPSDEYLRNISCMDGGFPTENFFHCFYCYDDCVTIQNPPLVYNVEKDPGERFPLSPHQHEGVIDAVMAAVSDHRANFKVTKQSVESCSINIAPCCNPPYCVCN